MPHLFWLFFAIISVYPQNCSAGLLDWLSKKLTNYNLPPEQLRYKDLIPQKTPAIRDRRGQVLWPKGSRQQYPVKMAEIPQHLKDFVILSEDAKFYAHKGFDVDEISKAMKENIRQVKIKRGGSTITQQLVKNLFLDKKRSWSRKIYEIPWAKKVENDLSKAQIISLYLNIIEWGPGIYGAQAASLYAFDKSLAELSELESIYLAMIIPNPKKFNIHKSPKMLSFLKNKKNKFVKRLHLEKKFDESKKQSLIEEEWMHKDLSSENRIYTTDKNSGLRGLWQKITERHPDLTKLKTLTLDRKIQTELFESEIVYPETTLPLTEIDPVVAQGLCTVEENKKIIALRNCESGHQFTIPSQTSEMQQEFYSWKAIPPEKLTP